jgi:Na+/proline symporter
MNKLLIIGISLGYLFLLFALAYRVERARRRGKSYVNNSWVYALSLAVYCTAWTYYGSVGRATTSGIEFITIYLGPSVMCALFLPVLVKMVRICRTQRINTIADFISTRYGKNFSLGVIVTLFCVLGIIPYISLQLKAISNSFHVVTGGVAPGFLPFWRDDSFYIAVIISVFIILFGTRSVDASERHEGLVGAVAFETIVKLVAFVAAGIFVTYGLFDGFGPLLRTAREKGLQDFFVLRSDHAYGNWLAMIVVSMLSLVLLPRQFQVAVVENTNEEHIRKAAWLFPLYLFVINLFVLPIALGGKLILGNAADADTYVLSLPLQAGQHLLSVFVYIGGLSAASSMIIVETIALATMVSNHFVLPGFLATTLRGKTEHTISKQILFSRRASIVVILWLAYLYNCYIASYFSLVSIGLVSMAAVAQFAPSVIGALYWKDSSRKGAIVGIVAGFAVWAYTLIVPSATDAGLIDQSILQGPFGISWLRPQALFGLDDFDLLAHSVFWSLLVNSFCFAIVSVYSKQSAQEIFQAKVFVDIMNSGPDEEKRSVWKGRASMTDVRTLLSNFLGTDRAQRLLTSYQLRHRLNEQAANADPVVVSFAEKILSGVIGSASARFMVSSITKEEEINRDEVLDIVRESQRVLELNKELKKNPLN